MNRVTIHLGQTGTVIGSIVWSHLVGQKSWSEVQQVHRTAWCTRHMARHARMLLCTRKVRGEQVLPHSSPPTLLTHSRNSAAWPSVWCTMPLHIPAKLCSGTFYQLAGTGLWKLGLSRTVLARFGQDVWSLYF